MFGDKVESYRYAPFAAVLSVVLIALVYNVFLAPPLGLHVYLNNTHMTYSCESCVVERIVLEVGAYYRATLNESMLAEGFAGIEINTSTRTQPRNNMVLSGYGHARIVIELNNSSGSIDVSRYVSRVLRVSEPVARQILALSEVTDIYVIRNGNVDDVPVNIVVGEEYVKEKYPFMDWVLVLMSAGFVLILTWATYSSRSVPGAGYLVALLVPPITLVLALFLNPLAALLVGTIASVILAFLLASSLKH